MNFEIFVIYLQIWRIDLLWNISDFRFTKVKKSFDDSDVDEIKLKENCALVQIKDIDF